MSESLDKLYDLVMGDVYKLRRVKDFPAVRELVAGCEKAEAEMALRIAQVGRALGSVDYPVKILIACFNDVKYKGPDKPDMKFYTDRIILNGSDLLWGMKYQLRDIGCKKTQSGRDIPLPMKLRKCMKARLEELSDDALMKGFEECEISLRDCIKMLHPSPVRRATSENSEFYKDCLDDNIIVTDVLSISHNLVAAVREYPLVDLLHRIDVLVENGGLLDNIDAVDALIARVKSPGVLQKYGVTPFTLYEAYNYLGTLFQTDTMHQSIIGALMVPLSVAMDIACRNTHISGFNAVCLDMSMIHSEREDYVGKNLSRKDAALLMAAITVKNRNGDVIVFGNHAKLLPYIDPKKSVIEIMKLIEEINVGHGTQLMKALEVVEENKNAGYDALIVLTDRASHSKMENDRLLLMNTTTLSRHLERGVYRQMFLCTLKGGVQGHMSYRRYGVNLITGFNENIFSLMNVYRKLQGLPQDVRAVTNEVLGSLPLL